MASSLVSYVHIYLMCPQEIFSWIMVFNHNAVFSCHKMALVNCLIKVDWLYFIFIFCRTHANETKACLCLCVCVHLIHLSNVDPHIMFLGSSVDEFQQTALLISINLPPSLSLAQQHGFPRLDSFSPGLLCQNKWASDQYVLDLRTGFPVTSLLKY